MTAALWSLLGLAVDSAWTPPDSGGLPPGEAVTPIPAPYEPLVARLRPEGPAVATLLVGPGREYTRISDAVARGRFIQGARPGRVDIVIDPGVYDREDGRIGIHDMALYSASGEPRSVTMLAGWDDATAPFYIEGIVADARTRTEPKYGMHASVGGGAGLIVGGELRHSDSPAGRPTPIGTDGGAGGYLLLYDVVLVGANTNNHQETVTADAFRMVYVKVRSQGGLALGSQNPSDELWVVDCDALYAGVAPQGRFYESGSTLGLAPGEYTIAPVERRDWPLPDGTRA